MTTAADWARCRGWIEAALKHAGGTHAIEDVEAGLATGQYQFWPGERSATITEIIDYPRLRALHVWFMGGTLADALAAVLPRIEVWGRLRGCSRITGGAYDRPGWPRALARAGFTPGWIILSKELTS